MEEASYVIAAESEGHLRQVIGAEREELGGSCHAVGQQRGARYLNHCSELVVNLAEVEFLQYFGKNLVVQLLRNIQFRNVTGDRDHQLGYRVLAFFQQFCRRFEHSPDLHL